jgi:hypothetical protein
LLVESDADVEDNEEEERAEETAIEDGLAALSLEDQLDQGESLT